MTTEAKNLVYPWNEPLLKKLAELKDQGVLPHAIALSSREGWGGLELLRVVCNLLLGLEQNTETSNQASSNHLWINPDGAVIKIDQVRSAIEFAYKTSQTDNYKVIAISQGHLLNVNASNAMLKVVEEPPTGTIIVLETSKWTSLPATLRSRFHRFTPNLSIETARTWLADSGVALSDQQFAEIGYAPLDAQNYALMSFSMFLEKFNDRKISEIVDEVLAIDCLAWLGNWYRFILGRIAIKNDQLEQRDSNKLFDFCDQLTFSRKEIEFSNSANKRLLIERLVLIWRNQNISNLISLV